MRARAFQTFFVAYAGQIAYSPGNTQEFKQIENDLLTDHKPLWIKHRNERHLACSEHKLALVPEVYGDFAGGIGLNLPKTPFRVIGVLHEHARR